MTFGPRARYYAPEKQGAFKTDLAYRSARPPEADDSAALRPAVLLLALGLLES